MKLLLFVISIMSLAVFTVACGGSQPAPTPQPTLPPPTPTVAPAPATAPPTTPPPAPADGIRIEVGLLDPGGTGSQKDPGGTGYVFDPKEFNFSEGDTVTFVLTAETEFHTFTVDDLGIDVGVDPGQTETFTFTFEEEGEFSLICIPHETLGMVGTITVQ